MSDATPGLKVEPTDRGFVVTVRHAGASGGIFGLAVVLALGAGVAGLVGIGVGMENPAVAAIAVVPAALGALLTLGAFALRRANLRRGIGRLVMDGERLIFVAMEGPADLELSQVKGVDLVPVGLAVRVRGGGAWHFPLPKVPPTGRTWLRDRLRAASERHGVPADVPSSIRALKAKETE